MVDMIIIDQNIDDLKKTGEFENNFILFISDNGAEGMEMEAMPIMGKRPMTFADIKWKFYDQFGKPGQLQLVPLARQDFFNTESSGHQIESFKCFNRITCLHLHLKSLYFN